MFYLLIFFAALCAVTLGCPPEEDIAPSCTCRHIGQDAMMYCTHITNPEELIRPIKSTISRKVKIFSLSIDNSSLLYVPHDLFVGGTFEKIRFLYTEIMSLSDSDLAFEGLEESLIEVRATGAHYIAQWDWQQLRNLKHIKLIDVNWITMGSVQEPFPELKRLTDLGITKAGISFIVDNAFSKLTSMIFLNMKDNDIKELKRNMFPNPATSLAILDFSDNALENLPSDLFTKMPNLQHLYMDRNHLLTLDEPTFRWPLEHLQIFTLRENKIRCDCRLRWMLKIRLPFQFTASCQEPLSLKGVQLKGLQNKDLWC